MNKTMFIGDLGSRVVYNADTIKPGDAADGVEFCPMPIRELTESRNKLAQNTVALGVMAFVLGLEFEVLQDALEHQFQRKGQDVVDENVRVARAGYDLASTEFPPLPTALPSGPKPLAIWNGNEALAMGGAAAGVKFYENMGISAGFRTW